MASSQAPSPTWIHTAAEPAATGWPTQAAWPQCTTCWTHGDEAPAVGSITCEGSPAGMFG